jgi:hypothetical protein
MSALPKMFQCKESVLTVHVFQALEALWGTPTYATGWMLHSARFPDPVFQITIR